MTKAIVVHQLGGPEVLSFEDVAVGEPGPGEIRVRNHAIGLNFVDTYERKGLYKVDPPFIAGSEGAGEVTAIGEGVTLHQVGDRVGYAGPIGAYAEERLLPAERAAPLPAGVDFDTAAAVTTKGITAYYLLHLTHRLEAGETILLHAAAGATGLLIAQWAHAIGARVIGTAGSAEKCALASEHGCDQVINYTDEDFVARVRELTGGKGVDVVYDGVGKVTFEPSLDCLRPRGLMVSFGNASGVVSIPDLGILARKGSLFVTRPTTGTYYARPEDFRAAAAAVYGAVQSGAITPLINQTFALKDAADAHRALEGRQTTGSTLLLP
jgi:NADPH2:quinone reductase